MEDKTVQRLKEELTQKVVEHQRRSDMLVIYQKWCKACGICYLRLERLHPAGRIDTAEGTCQNYKYVFGFPDYPFYHRHLQRDLVQKVCF